MAKAAKRSRRVTAAGRVKSTRRVSTQRIGPTTGGARSVEVAPAFALRATAGKRHQPGARHESRGDAAGHARPARRRQPPDPRPRDVLHVPPVVRPSPDRRPARARAARRRPGLQPPGRHRRRGGLRHRPEALSVRAARRCSSERRGRRSPRRVSSFESRRSGRPQFTRWADLPAPFDDLKRVLRRRRTSRCSRREPIVGDLLVEAAYDGMSGESVALAKTALLNAYFRLNQTREPVSDVQDLVLVRDPHHRDRPRALPGLRQTRRWRRWSGTSTRTSTCSAPTTSGRRPRITAATCRRRCRAESPA